MSADAFKQLTTSAVNVDYSAMKRYAKNKMRIYKLMHKIGNTIRKLKTAQLKASRGITKDRIFYKINSENSLWIVQRSPAYGFFNYVGWPIERLWIIQETAEDKAIAIALAREWFAPRKKRT